MKATLTLILALLFIEAIAQSKNIKLYAFGHSLIDHRPPLIPTPSDETTIMHWIEDIASYEGHQFAGGGQYGFLTNHDDLPPVSQWGYDSVPPVWDDSVEPFSNADVNTVIVTAANFIQYVPPTNPHPFDNNTSVVSSTETIFNWVDSQEPGTCFFIYENWPEMNLQNSYPPNIPASSEISYFHNETTGTFHDWWIEYQDSLISRSPQYNVRLIPVGYIISKLLRDKLPNQIPFDELYEDSAPHGRASLYFLAGLVTYSAIFQEQIPSGYSPGSIIHQTILDSLALISSFIWDELNAFNFPNGQSRVFKPTPTKASIETPKSNLELFPNPATNYLIVNQINKQKPYEIYDQNGKIHCNGFITGNIDISGLAPGVYNIIIEGERYKKFIKTQ
jgi:hypothetical protein